jgi:GDP-4-dehydro-6-deoxy-D-mannose reductase
MSDSVASGTLFITGASGFVGRHVLAEAASGGFGGLTAVAASAGLDLRDRDAVEAELASVRPAAVLHLAAQSSVPASFENPRHTLDVNLGGTLNLLEALTSTGFSGRLLYVSSGDIYGAVPEQDLPVTETRLPAPRNPYAVSKVAAELLCLQAAMGGRFEVIVARPFNHIGPGQDERFVVPSLAAQVVRIAEGAREGSITAGDIDVTRDFSDVRDVVRAYAALLRQGRSGEIYNVASGSETRVSDILATLVALAGIDATTHQDASRLRPSEQRRMVASADKLRRDTGWAPRFAIQQTLTDILDNFRTKDSP